jgi:mannose-6-phosphate isomerase-like protein (cupin superfamily)
MATETKTKARVFTFMNDELAAGRGDVYLPGTEGLSGVLKRYVEGGENRLHCHPAEDHVFYILQSQATFRLGSEENVVVAGTGEAVLLPAGTYYRFENTGDSKLLMIRVGNAADNHGRLDPAGNPITSTVGVSRQAVYAPERELRF